MEFSKNTIKELLSSYLGEKGIGCDNEEKILSNLFSDIDNRLNKQQEKERKEREKERKREKTRVSHGSSCPRIMTSTGELIVEF